jgi:hypothetical protein
MLKGGAASYRAKASPFFRCVICSALYHIVQIETDPEFVDSEAKCFCGAALPNREGQFMMKYFSLGDHRIRRRK